jgi:hemin uptake protein HemP
MIAAENAKQKPDEKIPDKKDTLKTISAPALFGGSREVCIEHQGERYLLRITRRGKLILQK